MNENLFLFDNKINIEESKQQKVLLEETLALERRNDYKIYNLQGQYNEKEMKERFLGNLSNRVLSK